MLLDDLAHARDARGIVALEAAALIAGFFDQLLDGVRAGKLHVGREVDLRDAALDALFVLLGLKAGSAVHDQRSGDGFAQLADAVILKDGLLGIDAVDGADGDGEAVDAGFLVEALGLFDGVVQLDNHCKRYDYDPLKRIPKKLRIDTDFTAEDFKL